MTEYMISIPARRRAGRANALLAGVLSALILTAAVAFLLLWRLREPPQAQRPPEAQAPAVLAEPPTPREAGKKPEEPLPAPALTPGERGDLVKAAETPGGVVAGTVRVAGTEKPAPGIQVVVRTEAPVPEKTRLRRLYKPAKLGKDDRSALSGADGRYRIEGLSPGDYRVFALGGETDFVPVPASSGQRITIGPEPDVQAVDIEVVLGGVIHGKVVDAEDQPLSGVKLVAFPPDFFASVFEPESGFLGFQEVATKEDGSYRIAGLPLEKRYRVQAKATDRAPALSEEVQLTEEEREVELDLVLLRGSMVSGRVLDGERAPVEGVKVRLARAESSPLFLEPLPDAETDASGGFGFKNLAAGKYSLTAQGAGKPASRDFECDGETEVPDIILILEGAGAGEGVLSGRVVDDTAAPVRGASLQLTGFAPGLGPVNATTTSEADGSFAFKGVSSGFLTLMARYENHAPFTKAGLAPGPSPIEVILQRVARVRGQVVSRSSGEPLSGAMVSLRMADDGVAGFARLASGQLPGSLPSATARPDGTFSLEKVIPGRSRIRAEASGFAPGHSPEFEIAPGQEVHGVKVALSTGGTAAGLVLAPTGGRVAGAAVRALEVSANPIQNQLQKMMPAILGQSSGPSARTEEDGSFRIDHLPEGKILFTAAHPDFAPSGEVEILLGQDEVRDRIQLRLQRPGTIRVQVREKEKPRPGLMVQLMGSGPMKMGSTAADGTAVFSAVGPGEYLLQVMDLASMASGLGLGMRQRAVKLAEGQAAEVEFTYGVGAKVHGKVTGALPGSMSVVVLRRPDAPPSEELNLADFTAAAIRSAEHQVGIGFIQKDGSYSIADVPDAEFTIEVPWMPVDWLKAGDTPPEERRPLYREKLKVEGGKDLEWNIAVNPRKEKADP